MAELMPTESNEKKGHLYLVSTPIGNWDDITLRGLKVLRNCDKVICEEKKIGGRLLKQYSINKDIDLLNEQNEEEKTEELIFELTEGKHLALISDAGTPVFADPGFQLVKAALRKGIDITVIPGPSSIMAAIVRSGFDINQFLYAGFLSRSKAERAEQLKALSFEKRTVVIFETPYRLLPFLETAKDILPYRNAYIGCNLTLPYETHHYGTFLELYKKFKEKRFKGEFVIVFEGLPRDTIFEENFKPYGSDDPKPKKNLNQKKFFKKRTNFKKTRQRL